MERQVASKKSQKSEKFGKIPCTVHGVQNITFSATEDMPLGALWFSEYPDGVSFSEPDKVQDGVVYAPRSKLSTEGDKLQWTTV